MKNLPWKCLYSLLFNVITEILIWWQVSDCYGHQFALFLCLQFAQQYPCSGSYLGLTFDQFAYNLFSYSNFKFDAFLFVPLLSPATATVLVHPHAGELDWQTSIFGYRFLVHIYVYSLLSDILENVVYAEPITLIFNCIFYLKQL